MADAGRTKRTPGKWLISLLVLASILALIVISMRPQPLQVETSTVERRQLTVTVQEQGRTRAKEPYTITAPVTGQLLRTPLREGDSVSSGQVIARIALAPEDQRTEAVIRANLDAAQARSTAAQASLQESESLLDRAEREALRRQQLFQQQMVSEEERDMYQQAVNAAQARAASARSSLRAAQAEVESARSQLIGIDNGAEHILSVVAPVDGTVYRVHEKSERIVPAGTPLFLLSDGDELELVIDLLTQQAVQVNAGDKILINGWGGEKTLYGRVRYVEPEAFTKFSALGVEEQRVNVIGELLDNNVNLGAEYRIEAAIVISEQDDVLTVAGSALFRRDGDWHVFAIEDGQAVLRAVVPGQRSSEYAEVLAGLQENDQVIIFPSDLVKDGVKVASDNS